MLLSFRMRTDSRSPSRRVIGLVSIGDLVKSIIADQKFIFIEQLEHYIQGGRRTASGRKGGSATGP